MRVLGIDCGTERTGWGVIDSDGRRHAVVAHGVIRLRVRDPLEMRLAVGLADSDDTACRLASVRTCEYRASIFWLTWPAIAMIVWSET